MSAARVAVAAGSRVAADAGAEVAARGGNAVDAAVAAALVSLCTDIGVVSPGGGAFVTVLPPDGDATVIDGYAAMPGIDATDVREDSAWEVTFDYKGETRQRVGFGTVAVPGAFAALAMAVDRYGHLPWAAVLEPAIRWAAHGAPLTGGAAEYLRYTHEAIYSWHPDSLRIVHRVDGREHVSGDVIRVPHLAESLRAIAREGVGVLYGGPLGRRIACAVREAGGPLTGADLAAYRAIERKPIVLDFHDWQVATNPVPSVGGSCLAALLALLADYPSDRYDADAVALQARVQHAVLSYRGRHLDGAGLELSQRTARLLTLARRGQPDAILESPSTIHVSAVDASGGACAITSSAGYGSGAIAPGTGIWLNNSLGEIDLLTHGLSGFAPGTRLASNMTPTVARSEDGSVLAIGTPGASRITTALAQVMHQHMAYGLDLQAAVEHPRLHVELVAGRPPAISCEPDLPTERLAGFTVRSFPEPSMYFGGVQVARWSPHAGLTAVGDTRRCGCVAYG